MPFWKTFPSDQTDEEADLDYAAFEAGFDAAEQTNSLKANPFTYGDSRWHSWNDGFFAGKQLAQDHAELLAADRAAAEAARRDQDDSQPGDATGSHAQPIAA